MYCLNMLEMALVLASHDPVYEDVATKFFEHFTYIASAMRTQGLWDEPEGFFFDVVHLADGGLVPLRVISMVGVVALFAVTVLEADLADRMSTFRHRMEWFLANKPGYADCVQHMADPGVAGRRLLSVVDPERLRRILAHVLAEDELLSPHGVRSLSRAHKAAPVSLDLNGVVATVDYEPAESTNTLFGGNSNWRGPVWFPLNYLLIESLRRFDQFLGDSYTVEYPTGSGNHQTLEAVANDLAQRLVGLFLPAADGTRPVFGGDDRFNHDPAWSEQLLFHEYFHGDTGAGLGASHQTGWTGLVADLISYRRLSGEEGAAPTLG
jgi:hypothetical protein